MHRVLSLNVEWAHGLKLPDKGKPLVVSLDTHLNLHFPGLLVVDPQLQASRLVTAEREDCVVDFVVILVSHHGRN
jgi:hypothetical protein